MVYREEFVGGGDASEVHHNTVQTSDSRNDMPVLQTDIARKTVGEKLVKPLTLAPTLNRWKCVARIQRESMHKTQRAG